MRFVDFVAPRMLPAFEDMLDGIKRWSMSVEGELFAFWRRHGASISKWWTDSILPALKTSWEMVKQIGGGALDIASAMLGEGPSGKGKGQLTKLGHLETIISNIVQTMNTWLGYAAMTEQAAAGVIRWAGGWRILGDVMNFYHDTWVKVFDAVTNAWQALEKFEKSPIIKFLEDMLNSLQKATDAWNALAQGISKVTGGQTGSDGTALPTDDNPAWKLSRGTTGSWGSTSDFTQYGPAIDPKGSPYYDSDSYNGIGHINGQKFDLNSEPSGTPSAMKWAYGTGHYHIKPGDYYISDKDHKRHRWMDTTGSQNSENEDIYFREKPTSSTNDGNRNLTINQHFHGVHDRDFALRMKEALHQVLRTSYV
jgi:hypothetical protein